MNVPFMDLKLQYAAIKNEILRAVEDVLESSHFVLGKEVAAFEEEFAAFSGAQYGVAVNTGTSALHLALLAAGIGPGHEVITVPCTFVATVAAIVYTGATPVFVDVDPATYTMDINSIEAAITPRTKAFCRYIYMAIRLIWTQSSGLRVVITWSLLRTPPRRTPLNITVAAVDPSATWDASASILARTWALTGKVVSSQPTTPISRKRSECCATGAQRRNTSTS